MKHYTIEYKLHAADKVRTMCVLANNKADAYEKALFEEIPRLENDQAYSAWVAAVTYQNGNYHIFNTFEGLPY